MLVKKEFPIAPYDNDPAVGTTNLLDQLYKKAAIGPRSRADCMCLFASLDNGCCKFIQIRQERAQSTPHCVSTRGTVAMTIQQQYTCKASSFWSSSRSRCNRALLLRASCGPRRLLLPVARQPPLEPHTEAHAALALAQCNQICWGWRRCIQRTSMLL